MDAASVSSEKMINVLIATFAGLGLPRTLSLPTNASTAIGDLHTTILKRLPDASESLIITTVSNKQLLPSNPEPVTSLLSSPEDRLLSLRISTRLCGGKGGFGSQLRAAGGRMSSRKNRDRQNQDVDGSNRNLDGRRLRTVNEAKKLAEYLALKPEMEQREREERKKRWEAVVDAAERRELEIKSGKAGSNQGRLDARYVESKELAEEKTREAMLRIMKEGLLQERTGSESSEEPQGNSEDEQRHGSESGESWKGKEKIPVHETRFFGWDDDDDDDDEEDEEKSENTKESMAA